MTFYIIVVIFVAFAFLSSCQADNYTYTVRFQALSARDNWEYSHCSSLYSVTTGIYAIGGPFNYEYFTCNTKSFQEYLTKNYVFSKDGSEGPDCLCQAEMLQNGSRVGPKGCLYPGETMIMTQIQHQGYEKNWTSDELCAWIPKHPGSDDSDGSSVGLILGIIGGVLALGAIVGFILFRKRKASSQQQYQKFSDDQKQQNSYQ